MSAFYDYYKHQLLFGFKDDALCALLFIYTCTLYRRLKDNNRRLTSSQSSRTEQQGYFEAVFQPMKAKNGKDFLQSTCMTASSFDSLSSLVQKDLIRVVLPQKISVEERLSITLMYLTRGVSHQNIARIYKLSSVELAHDIILRTCEVLWNVLQPIYVVEPSATEYKSIAKNFNTKWHVPNCVGAICCKQISLTDSAQEAEPELKNLILLATCDDQYTFTSVSFGNKDELRSTSFGQCLMDNVLSLPSIRALPGSYIEFPFYFAGDSGLPLRNNLMRPYPGLAQNRHRQIFNYRLSRAHQVIENAFGILVDRWRILKKPINASAEEAEKIVLAVMALHNFVITKDRNLLYCPKKYTDWEDKEHNIIAGGWRAHAKSVNSALLRSQCCMANASKSAFKQRDDLAKYFEYEGAVEFQYEAISNLQYTK